MLDYKERAEAKDLMLTIVRLCQEKGLGKKCKYTVYTDLLETIIIFMSENNIKVMRRNNEDSGMTLFNYNRITNQPEVYEPGPWVGYLEEEYKAL
jgi:hypothetical protein